MNENSDADKDARDNNGVSERLVIDDDSSLDHLLDKPPSIREYFKALFYFVVVVLVGVLLAVLVFLANK